MTKPRPLVSLFVSCVLFAPASSFAGQYVFTKISDQTTIPGASAFRQNPDDGPTINDKGDVVYVVDVGAVTLVVLNSGGVETVLADNVPFTHVSPVNNNGTVVLTSFTSLVTVGSHQSTIPGSYDRLSNGVINDNNEVAFRGRFGGSGPEAIYLASGGTISQIAALDGAPAAINNAGQVAILDIFDSIVVTTTTIVNAPSDPDIGNVSGPISMNESGVVAFRGGLTGGGFGIVTGDGGPLDIFADSRGDFTVIGKPNINDHGNITFRPNVASGNAIYTGPDPFADRVIGAGVFPVTEARTGRESLRAASPILLRGSN